MKLWGWIAMGCWIVVYLPQMTENYRLQSGEGLSLIFLVTWMISDICRLGGILSSGSSWVPAVIWFWAYLILSDFFLLTQVYYYRWKRSCYPIGPLLFDSPAPGTSTPAFADNEPGYERYVHESECEYDESDYLLHHDLSSSRRRRIGISERQDTLPWVVLRSTLCLVAISTAAIIAWWVDQSYFVVGSGGTSGNGTKEGVVGMRRATTSLTRPAPGGISVSEKETWRNLAWSARFVMHAFGYTSPILQVFGKISQIVKNLKTRCQGLSLSLYLFMIYGDSAYILSIIFESLLQKDDTLQKAGWLAGFGISNLLSIMILYYQYTDGGRITHAALHLF